MIDREEVLVELEKLGVVLKDGSVYAQKTLRMMSFDFYDEEGRKGLKLAWFDFEHEAVTAKLLAEAIRDLRDKACLVRPRDLWLPATAFYILRWAWPNKPEWVPRVRTLSSE